MAGGVRGPCRARPASVLRLGFQVHLLLKGCQGLEFEMYLPFKGYQGLGLTDHLLLKGYQGSRLKGYRLGKPRLV